MMFTSDEILRKLAGKLSEIDQREKTWLAIGDALHGLEARDAKTLDGRPWHVVLQLFLEEQGLSVSSGHINKVRRVHKFVRNNVEQSISDTDLTAPQVQFSALEMAERLHTLDHEAGVAALKECLKGLTFGAMRDRYESFREARPEMLPPRQRAWLDKRMKQDAESATSVAQRQDAIPAMPSNTIHRLSQGFAQELWREAYEKGRSDAVAEAAEKDLLIQTLRERIEELEGKGRTPPVADGA
jgi:hypothetical protein